MASWNSYGPWWWQSLYQPWQVNENELSDLAESNQADGAGQPEARRKTPVSLLDDLARLPAAPSFENFPVRPLYPFLGAPGTMQWFDSVPFFGTGLGPAAAAAPSFHPAGVPASPFLGTPGQINWPDPPKPPVRPVDHLASAQFWPAGTMPSPIHGGRLPDDAFSPSRNFQAPDTDAVPRDRFADAAQEFPAFQPLLPPRAPAEGISRMATNEPPDEAAVAQDARRAAAMRTGQWARHRRQEYELDSTQPEITPAQDVDEPDTRERARLNLVDSYYRTSLAGIGSLKMLKHIASTPDPEVTTPANRNLRQSLRNEYRQITADLARYDRMRDFETPSELVAAAAGQFAGAMPSPESWLTRPVLGVKSLWRAGIPALRRGFSERDDATQMPNSDGEPVAPKQGESWSEFPHLPEGSGFDPSLAFANGPAARPEIKIKSAASGSAVQKAVTAGLTLLGWLSSRNGPEGVTALLIPADLFKPTRGPTTANDDEDIAKREAIRVKGLTKEETQKYCDLYSVVQKITTSADRAARQLKRPMTPSAHGTEVHMQIAHTINGPGGQENPRDPDFRAEYSLLKAGAAIAADPEAKYGQRGTIRVDVLENRKNGTICVYDIKTGRAELPLNRAREIAQTVFRRYKDVRQIIVVEVRP